MPSFKRSYLNFSIFSLGFVIACADVNIGERSNFHGIPQHASRRLLSESAPSWHPAKKRSSTHVFASQADASRESTPPATLSEDTKKILQKVAPDILDFLPIRFEKGMKNPCFLSPSQDGRASELLCLPYFIIAGGFQCGVPDFDKRLHMHPQVPSQYTSRSVWWTNHPKGSSGNFSKYVHGFPNGAKAVKASPETTILGDVSASYASFIMAEHLRLHHTFLSESATCRDQCRAGKAPAESSDKCPPKTTGPKYKFDHCFPEGQAAMAPIDFNVPALISTVYQPAKPPFVVMLLRNPTERLWAAFWTYGQFPGQYGKSNAGFLAYFEEQSAAWDKCVALHDVHTCGLRFETLAPEFEDVFYHGDQLLKGMYSIFVEDWVKWIGRDRVLVMRSEDYYEELGSGSGRPSALIKTWELLSVPPASEELWTGSEGSPVQNEHAKVLEEHGEMPAEIRARVDAFYQPFKADLASILNDSRFLWET
ncbi:hypothetical protein CYMTET_48852 [Cymbomonas tetramitiformis]|uniref:Sulfotransferase n=1 Tax=Cymbomonas tetramitiformis TaxID=36881 RepID=A0AAE0EV43_9CHLO|nr:hypothetical protein CYMTET_48852 [Cymbomonas tetramitiformis]